MTLEISGLSVRAQRRILGPLDFCQPHHRSLAIMGASGHGKTTLAKAILGLLSSFSLEGDISFAGLAIHRHKRSLLPVRLRRFGYIPQQLSPWPHLSVRQALKLALAFSERLSDEPTLDEIAESFGLSAFLDRLPSELSSGQCQRLALACTMAACPRLVIFDEALSALDIVAKATMIELIKSWQKRWPFALIFITHDLREALAVADDFLFIDQGRKLWHGPQKLIHEAPFCDTWNPLKSPLFAPCDLYQVSLIRPV